MEGQEPFDHNVMRLPVCLSSLPRLLEHPGFPSEGFGGVLRALEKSSHCAQMATKPVQRALPAQASVSGSWNNARRSGDRGGQDDINK